MISAGVPNDVADMLIATRMIVLAISNAKVAISTEEIARVCKLDEREVVYVLASPTCREMLDEECRLRVSKFLSQSVGVLEDIRDNAETKPKEKTEAIRAGTTLYRTMAQSAPKHNSLNASASREELMKKLEAMNELKRAKVQVTNAPTQ